MQVTVRKDTEIGDFNTQVERQRVVIEDLTKRLAAAKNELESDVDLLAEKDAEIEDLKKQLEALKKQYAPCPGTIADLRQEVEAITNQLAASEAQNKDLKKRLAAAESLITEKDAEIEDLKKQLEALKKKYAKLEEKYAPYDALMQSLKKQLSSMEEQLDALRRQIKETKDAVELDEPRLLNIKAKVEAETADRKKQLEAKGGRVKLGASAPPKGGALHGPAASGSKPLPEFGAMDLDGDGMLSKQEFQSRLRIMEWSLEEAEKTFKALDRDGDGGISASEYAAFCQMEDKNLEFETLDGIAKLRQQLANLQARLAAVASKDASKDAEIEDLKKRLAEMTAAKELLARTCAAHEATLTDRDAEIQTLKKLVAEIKNIINSKVSKPVPVLCHSSDVPCDWFRLCVTLKC